MSDPERLRYGQAPLTRIVLESAASDVPPAGARERAIQALGASLGSALIAREAAASTGGIPAGVATAARVGAPFLIKGLVVGFVAAAVGTAGLVTHVAPRDASPVASVNAPPQKPVSALIAQSAPDARVKRAPNLAASAAPQRAGQTPSVLHPRASAEVTPSAITTSSLADERTTLEVARRALDAGRASVALKALSDYEQRHGFGILGHEETVLRIEALLALGSRDQAILVGQNYLRQHPAGTQVSKVEVLLAQAAGGAPARLK